MLASASDAIIIGFNVRPAGNARQLADKEEIDIRYYSIIYAAIDDLKDAMEGMLAPEKKRFLVLLKLERYLKYLKLDLLQVVW
jgi:translation initiation factor IF-2